MSRKAGVYRTFRAGGETFRAFTPSPLPPKSPTLCIEGILEQKHTAASTALQRLSVAAMTVPSLQWFLYGFVRKEAVISSQIEGTQATFEDLVHFEATKHTNR